jgi:hypothetical protein
MRGNIDEYTCSASISRRSDSDIHVVRLFLGVVILIDIVYF